MDWNVAGGRLDRAYKIRGLQKVNTGSVLLSKTDERRWQMPSGNPVGRGGTGLKWESMVVKMVIKIPSPEEKTKATSGKQGKSPRVQRRWVSVQLEEQGSEWETGGKGGGGGFQEVVTMWGGMGIQSVQYAKAERQPGGSAFRNF